MPTPVNIAKICLTDEAARTLDEAVSVARRRSHVQTTSLHAVSALLALPSSPLREACARARSSAYSPRLQFRALELSVGVSLDRLPSSKTLDDDPPVSNSLMTAIKRSQANQRRQPESFHLHQIINQQQQQMQQPTSLFKVELKQFILSILDDPIVSRVLGEAGFRSYDVKFTIVHPPVSVSSSRLSKIRCPPIFLCNLTDSDLDQKGFSYPFLAGEDGNENCRRIGKILVRRTSKNPLLIGTCANDAMNSFAEFVQKGEGGGVLPGEVDGLCVTSIEDEVSEFVNNGGNKEKMNLRLKELEDMLKNCCGPGIVVIFGDLKQLVDDDNSAHDLSYLIAQFTSLLELYREKLWLIGVAGSYESYMKLLARFPSIEKDLDLHLLPITSSSRPSFPDLCSKSSLTGSFVPFGGFFSDSKNLLTHSNEFKTRCIMCNKKYDEEASSLKKECNVSIAYKCTSVLPSWLQMTESDSSNRTDAAKAKDTGALLDAKIVELQKKWDGICHSIHYTPQLPKPDIISQPRNRNDKSVIYIEDKKENGNRSLILYPHTSTNSNSPNEQIPVSSVITDLGLGNLYASTKNPRFDKNHEKFFENLPKSASDKFDLDQSDFKSVLKVLLEKVGRQKEAICSISESISVFKSGKGKFRGSLRRGDLWLSLLGPDKLGKQKIGLAIAEIVFGNRESLISLDLSSFENGIDPSNSIFRSQILDGYDSKFRGKTVVDYLAEQLRIRPHSVVFLENIDKADLLAQTSLSRAIRTGKFPDSHGREIGINNVIFVTTSSITKGNQLSNLEKENIQFSEEAILEAKNWQMQILIRNWNEMSNLMDANKRKMTNNDTHESNYKNEPERAYKVSRTCLDLNLPLSQVEDNDDDDDDSQSWLDDFLNEIDEKAVLEPFDFDSIGDKLSKEIKFCFKKVFGGCNVVKLDIDKLVMIQIIAAYWLSDDEAVVEEWVKQVLGRSFEEVKQRRSYSESTAMMVKLVACQGFVTTDGVHLPANIRVLHE